MGSFHISCGITQHRIEMFEDVIVVPYLRNVLVKEDLDFQNEDEEYRNVFSTELFSYDIKPILATYDDYGRCLPKIKGESAEEIITQCNLKFFLEKVLKYCVEIKGDNFKQDLEQFLSKGELLKAWKLTTDKIQDKKLFVDGGMFSNMLLRGLKQVNLFVFKKDCFDWIDEKFDYIRNNFAEKYPAFKDELSDMYNNLKTLSPEDYGSHYQEVWFLNSIKPSLEGYIKSLNLIEDHLELNDKDFERKMDNDFDVKFDRNIKVLDLIKMGQNKRAVLKEDLKNKTLQEKFAILYQNNLILSHIYENYNLGSLIEEMARKTNYLFEHFDIEFNQNNLYRSENIDPSLDFIKLLDYCRDKFFKRIKENDKDGDYYSYILKSMKNPF